MKLRFLGAAGEVTGSACHILANGASILVDCGMFQGGRQADRMNRNIPRLEGGRLDAVLLTHGHLDHSGRLPVLARKGYTGPIFATQATIDMSTLIMKDSARIQEGDAERANRKRARARQEPVVPLYAAEDVEAILPLMRPVKYDAPVEVAPGIRARFADAGHMLGSSSIELTVEEGGRRKVVVFSGDLGPRGAPLLRNPVPFERADLVVMESTYGDRDHRPLQDTVIEAREIIRAAIERRGKMLIPVFAVGRAQLLLYLLAGAFSRRTLPRFPIYLDSPMAIEATRIYGRHVDLFDEEGLAMMKSGELRRQIKSVKLCATAADSKALNDARGPCMIMAGAGMCTGGRILHHLKHNLPSPDTAVLIVGFQAYGSLGRQLVDGAPAVRIHGEMVPVRASVHTLGGFSAHASQRDLLAWFGAAAPSKPRLVLAHGEERARQALSRLIQSKFGTKAEIPAMGGEIAL